MTVTFKVSKVELCQTVLPKATVLERLMLQDDIPDFVSEKQKKRMREESTLRPILSGAEAWGANTPDVVRLKAPKHGLMQAVHLAYQNHYPLVLSPDDLWLCLAQGFSLHVLSNAEAMRDRFVPGTAAGTKERIEIYRDFFVKGCSTNDWPGCFDEFSIKIGERIGEEKIRLVRSNFSTTTGVEKAASEVVLMEAMSSFFEYRVMTLCGIPEITLLGTVADWTDIMVRAQALAEYCPSAWIEKLVPITLQFVQAASGNPDVRFWEDIYKHHQGGSGGPHISGWIDYLFPYLGKGRLNRFNHNGPDEYPPGLSTAPFTWVYYTTEYNMEFIGGFVGAHQDSELRVRPSIGWAVKDADS